MNDNVTTDNVITEANSDHHPAITFYAFPLTGMHHKVMGKVDEDTFNFDDEEIVYLSNYLVDVAFIEGLTVNEFAVMSLLFRASIGQGNIGANFCFLYMPEHSETSNSIMKGLGEKAFTEAFDSLVRRKLIKRVDDFVHKNTDVPPESYVYDNRQHYWEYPPKLTYLDLRPFFRDFCTDDPGLGSYPIILKYFNELSLMEARIIQTYHEQRADVHLDELQACYRIPKQKISKHGHLILLDVAK